jgi:hypothetical protein
LLATGASVISLAVLVVLAMLALRGGPGPVSGATTTRAAASSPGSALTATRTTATPVVAAAKSVASKPIPAAQCAACGGAVGGGTATQTVAAATTTPVAPATTPPVTGHVNLRLLGSCIKAAGGSVQGIQTFSLGTQGLYAVMPDGTQVVIAKTTSPQIATAAEHAARPQAGYTASAVNNDRNAFVLVKGDVVPIDMNQLANCTDRSR